MSETTSRPSPAVEPLDPSTKRRAWITLVVFVVLIGSMVGIAAWGLPVKGERRGAVPVPGETALDLKGGEIVRFMTDAEVVFLDLSNV